LSAFANSLHRIRLRGITLSVKYLLRLRRVLLAPRNEGIPNRRATVAIKIDKNGHPVPNGKGKRWWSRLSQDERRLHTDWRFDAGHTNSAVMTALDLSVGTVSGIKRIWRDDRRNDVKHHRVIKRTASFSRIHERAMLKPTLQTVERCRFVEKNKISFAHMPHVKKEIVAPLKALGLAYCSTIRRFENGKAL